MNLDDRCVFVDISTIQEKSTTGQEKLCITFSVRIGHIPHPWKSHSFIYLVQSQNLTLNLKKKQHTIETLISSPLIVLSSFIIKSVNNKTKYFPQKFKTEGERTKRTRDNSPTLPNFYAEPTLIGIS